MRSETNASQNSAVRITSPANWRAIEILPLPNYRLQVKFIDRSSGTVNMEKLITSAGAGVFSKLRDQAFFNKVYIERGVITWPGELDLAPDAMYDAIQQSGEWTPE
ncbi:MAG: DUF2442 domain-containing protein [Gammaproteobacteria bacterium]|nr:DUF2442 domain-containing protein [Gammaproteobacteria bacterium]